MRPEEIREHMVTARDEYIDRVKKELLGPGSEFSVPDAEHELISSRPLSRYSVGILYPQGNQVNQDNDETLPLTDDSDAEDAADAADVAERDEVANTEWQSPTEPRGDRVVERDETADENLDEEVGLSAQYMPSSMGITFLAEGNTDMIKGKASFATYRTAKVTDCILPFYPDNPADYAVPVQLSHKIA